MCGERYNGNSRSIHGFGSANRLGCRKAIHHGHLQVHEDQVEVVLLQRGHGLGTIAHHNDLVAAWFE
jgi:hypothetical protein